MTADVRHTVDERVSDYLERAYRSLCECYGVDEFEWGFPDEGDAEEAERNLVTAWTSSLERALYWKA